LPAAGSSSDDANRSLDPDDLAMFRDLTADRDSLVDSMRLLASDKNVLAVLKTAGIDQLMPIVFDRSAAIAAVAR
jgi:hypothetical protein